MNFLRLVYASAWTLVWGLCRIPRYLKRRNLPLKWRLQLAFRWGRYDSPKPSRCVECGWVGPLCWSGPGFCADGFDGDGTPCDNCPACGAEDSVFRWGTNGRAKRERQIVVGVLVFALYIFTEVVTRGRSH